MMTGTGMRQTEAGPFGPPDGAPAGRDEIIDNFVDFADEGSHDDLAKPVADESTCLIVGKKGVGKTVYLRCFQANADDDESVYAANLYHDVPATEDVIKICDLYPDNLVAEAWEWIWRRAIMRALISHLLCEPGLRNQMDPKHVKALEGEFRPRLGAFRRPHSVYSEAQALAVETQGKDSLARELRHRDWIDIEALLDEILGRVKPIRFYLDSFDEHFASAPAHWLECQKGLCRQVLKLDQRFGNGLRVMVSVRDLVYATLLQCEHATRYPRTRYIRVLDWDHAAIKHFLHEKAGRLSPELRLDPSKDGVEGWLGRYDIYIRARGNRETLEDYLLRHTRQIPRDVVQLGNELSYEVAHAKARGDQKLGDDAIRSAVAAAARQFADEQIAVCANHFALETAPPTAERQQIPDVSEPRSYSTRFRAELCHVIGAVGRDRFPLTKLKDALKQGGAQIVRSPSDPLHVLWLNGLLGWVDGEHGFRFYGARTDAELPEDREEYVFHPIVGHSLHITAAGRRPVLPWAEPVANRPPA
jgi:hypothetical protein